ncbi:MAG TPA: transposase [Anaerovoracaceae bacterium]|nr:transposase [Anaerovoracaceae bacterium]
MNVYPDFVKSRLLQLIEEMAQKPDPFVKNPGKDFSWNRKLNLAQMLRLILSMGGSSFRNELMEYFSYGINAPSASSFVQQRDKILPAASEFLLHRFTASFSDYKTTSDGFRLLAVDGSDLGIAHNPNDSDTYVQSLPEIKGFNLLHLNAGPPETIITNPDKEEFPACKIKELYHMRWGIETSFRELKYSIGLTSFHSKKAEYIIREIFAGLTMYNFCELITLHLVIQQKDTKYSYQANFTAAITICRYFFKFLNDISPPDVEALIQKNLLPIRTGRSGPRKVRFRTAVSFLYRVA